MTTKLLPCPFCGGGAILGLKEDCGDWFVGCKECRTTSGDCPSQLKIVEMWNRRAPSPREQRLEAALKAIADGKGYDSAGEAHRDALKIARRALESLDNTEQP